jgi:hypothetical protein
MSRRRPPAGPRLRLAAPLPRLPRTLRAVDVAYGRRHIDWPRGQRFPNSCEAEPFTAADLTTDIKGRLLARAEARLVRLQAADRLTMGERFWLREELRLVLLGGVHPNVVRRWRREIRWRVRSATDALAALQTIEAVVLAHEPTTDAWLRRQLSGLAEGTR